MSMVMKRGENGEDAKIKDIKKPGNKDSSI